jgi:hypothetical protein
MGRVTRDIDPAEARDLLERVPRACLSFVDPDNSSRPTAEPVAFVLQDERYFVGIRPGTMLPSIGDEVVLLIDEGLQFFDLRAIYIRGRLSSAAAESLEIHLAVVASGTAWFEVVPTKVVAWDYGRMREVDDEP